MSKMYFGKDWSKEIEDVTPETPVKNGKYAPQHPFRALIFGPSGSGKTFSLLSLICGDDPETTIYFDEIYICARQVDGDPAYEILRNALARSEAFINEQLLESGQIADLSAGIKIAHWYTSPAEMIGVIDKLDDDLRRVVVFDDQELNQKGPEGRVMQEFYQRGRKKNCSTIFIAQTYYGTSIFIRRNINYRIIFRPTSRRDMTALLKDIGSDEAEFKRVADIAWAQPHGFVVVDSQNKVRAGFKPADADDEESSSDEGPPSNVGEATPVEDS